MPPLSTFDNNAATDLHNSLSSLSQDDIPKPLTTTDATTTTTAPVVGAATTSKVKKSVTFSKQIRVKKIIPAARKIPAIKYHDEATNTIKVQPRRLQLWYAKSDFNKMKQELIQEIQQEISQMKENNNGNNHTETQLDILKQRQQQRQDAWNLVFRHQQKSTTTADDLSVLYHFQAQSSLRKAQERAQKAYCEAYHDY